jgi:hypothetical protein
MPAPAIDVSGLKPDKVISLNQGRSTTTHTFYKTGDPSKPVVEVTQRGGTGTTSQTVYRPEKVAGKEVLASRFGTINEKVLALDSWIKHLETQAKAEKQSDKAQPTQQQRAKAESPRAEKKDETRKKTEKKRTERAKDDKKDPAPKKVEDKKAEEKKIEEKKPEERATQEAPPPPDTSGAFGEAAAEFDKSAGETQKAIGGWQEDIENEIGEGRMGAVAGTIASTGLKVLSFAVDSAKDTADLLRIGGGIREGTLKGVGKDVLRMASMMPGVKWLGAGAKALAGGAQLAAGSKAASAAAALIQQASGTLMGAVVHARDISKNPLVREAKKAFSQVPTTAAEARQYARNILGYAKDVEYGAGRWWQGHIQSYAQWKAAASGAFMDVHHLFPEHLLKMAADVKYSALQRYVPAIMVEGQAALQKAGKATEHALIHDGLNKLLNSVGYWEKSLSKQQLMNAMRLTEQYYRANHVPHMADAVQEFMQVFKVL